MANDEAIIGSLVGTAVGDALGLPYEGLAPDRAARLFPASDRHHLVFGKGLVSDDTEHSCLVARALIRSRGDVERFERELARSLKVWLLGLPAGVGFATLRAILKLWLGARPETAGVFSAGNGPAMRSPIIGVALGDYPSAMRRFVGAATRITHTDPKACHAALAVALAAHQSSALSVLWPDRYLEALKGLLAGDGDAAELYELARAAAESASRGETVADFAERIGSINGIGGYSYHTAPCVLQTWFRHADDFAGGLTELIEAGGDTDTAGAIFGGIVGARVGRKGIPERWREDIIEWPRTIRWIEALGSALAESLPAAPSASRFASTPAPALAPTPDSGPAPARASAGSRNADDPWYFLPGTLLRNLGFIAVVLVHGLRRLAPPY